MRWRRAGGYPRGVRRSWIPNAAPALWVAPGVAIAVVVAATLPPLIGVAVVGAGCAAAAFALLDGWQRIYAATLLLLVMASSSNETLAQAAYYPRFAAAGLLAAWTWIAARGQAQALAARPPVTQWLVRGLWLAAGLTTASVLWSVDRPETAAQAIALVSLVSIVHGLLTRRWHDPDAIARDLRVGFWMMTGTFVASLAAFALGVSGAASYFGRMQGVYNNPNLLAFLCTLTIAIGWGLFRHYRNPAYLAGVLVAFAAVLLSESRTSLIALVAGAAWLIARTEAVVVVRSALLIGIATLSYGVGAALGFLPRPEVNAGTLERFTSGQGGDLLNARGVSWSEALEVWSQAPVGGVGYGAAPTVFSTLIGSGNLDFSTPSVHNSYLQWFMEVGLLGLVPLAVLLAVALVTAVRAPISPLTSGLVWAVVAGLTIQIAESAMFGTGQPYPYLFWPAVAGAGLASATMSETTSPRRTLTATATTETAGTSGNTTIAAAAGSRTTAAAP